MRTTFTFALVLWTLISNGQHIIDSLKTELNKNSKSDTIRVDILNEICLRYLNNDPDSLLAFAKKSLALSKALKYHKGIATALKFIGSAYQYKGNFKEAEKFQMQAIEYAQHYNFLKPQLANAILNLANAQTEQGNYLGAMDNYFEALKINESINNFDGTAKCLANIGSVYHRLNDLDNSLNYFLKAYAVVDKHKNLEFLKAALANNISGIYVVRKNYKECLKYILTSLQLNILANNEVDVIQSMGNVGNCYLAMNQIDKAAHYIEKAFQLSRKIQNENIKATIVLSIGRLRIEQGRMAEAIAYAKESLQRSIKLNASYNILTSYQALAEAYSRCNQYEKAYYYFNKSYLLYDSLKGDELNSKISEIQKSYEVTKKEAKIDQLHQQAQFKELALHQERTVKYILLAGLAIIIALAYTIFRIKTKLNNQLRERYQKIKKQNEVIEAINHDLRSQALRAQMNPHFIFNALNSIQHLILKNNTEAAFHYLLKFSELLRSVLDNSDKQWISIREEIKTLELYMELESLRFNGEFDYTIKYSSPASFDYDSIPSMIMQPFIENAIVHGLRNKTGEKKLDVIFSKENGVISCEVTDNGIGRQAAHALRSKQMAFIESKGIKLVEQRLKVLNNLTQRDFSIEVVDLFQGQQPSGTKVTLTFTHA